MASELEPRVFRASALVARSPAPRDGGWPPAGTVIELCGGLDSACTSTAFAAVAAAQRCGGITAWLQPRHGLLFPPDCARSGVDLDALVVIHVPPPAANVGTHGMPKAAELLLRSGAFDLLVLDLRPSPPQHGALRDSHGPMHGPMHGAVNGAVHGVRGAVNGAVLSRLHALAREHDSRVLLLSDARAPIAAGTGLSQRLHVRRRRDGASFVLEPQLVRDKLRATPPTLLPHRGPAGLQ